MIDSHCHLAGEEFASDLDDVVTRARTAGVTAAMCILSAGDEAERARVAAVEAAWPGIRFAVGVHPHRAAAFEGDPEAAATLLRGEVAAIRASAIGEIGLDYHYDFAPKPVQQGVFSAQVRLARELSLPIVIHTREATEDTFRVLQEDGQGAVAGVFHCFTGDEVMARAALDIGFHLSFAGILTFPRAVEIRQAARMAPVDRLLVETDAPYLAPVPFRGKRNEPAHVMRVVEALAELRGEAPGTLGEQLTANFSRLFAPRAAAR